MYLHIKNEVSRSRLSTASIQTGQRDRQTDATGRITTPCVRTVMKFRGQGFQKLHVTECIATLHSRVVIKFTYSQATEQQLYS